MEASDGMTAYNAAGTSFGLSGVANTAGVSNGVANRQSFVGLSGGFGAVNIGKQYSDIFNAACGYDLGGCAAMVGSLPLVVVVDQGGDVRRSNQVNFTLPKFVDGLSINVGKSFGETVKLGSASSNPGDGTNYSFSYRTGGFSATMASETLDNSGSFSGLIVNEPTASTTAKKKTTVTGLSYDVSGMAKVAYTNAKTTIGAGQSLKGNSFGVSVPLGAASVAYEAGTGESTSSGTNKLKASQLAFNYSLSKRTLAYFRQGSQAETASTGGNVLKLSTTAFGINHSF